MHGTAWTGADAAATRATVFLLTSKGARPKQLSRKLTIHMFQKTQYDGNFMLITKLVSKIPI